MSQNSEEIKTLEQWRWSEMQGIELVSSSATVSNSHESNPALEKKREEKVQMSNEIEYEVL